MLKQRGFTMIELLVVVAIIGIISIMALVSLSVARDNGGDAKIKSEMINLAKRAAVEESQVGTYDGTCGTNGYVQAPGIIKIIESIEETADTNVVCHSDINAFALSIALSDGYWCVDSGGMARQVTTGLDPAVPTFVCPN